MAKCVPTTVLLMTLMYGMAAAEPASNLSSESGPLPATKVGSKPFEIKGTAGGPLNLADEALPYLECRGMAQSTPNHVFFVKPGLLQFELRSDAGDPPPNLFVKLPDGRIACGSVSRQNIVSVSTSTAPGNVLVWVGATAKHRREDYHLKVIARPAPKKSGPGFEIAEAVPDGSDLVAGKPVQLKCAAYRTEKGVGWSPPTGGHVEVAAAQRGPFVSIGARVPGKDWDYLVDVPQGLASDACVQVELRPDGRLLVNAYRQRSDSGDPGQIVLWLLAFDASKQSASVVSQWTATARGSLPAWAQSIAK